jgi:HSP20 family protein
MEKQSQEVTRGQQSSVARNRGEWSAMRPFDWTPRDFFSAGPFSLMRRMSEEMDRVFGEFGFGRTSRDTNTSGETNMWSPAMDVSERDGKYVIHADLPGLKPEDINVEATNDALVIEGERKSESDDTKGGIRRTERRYGRFYRAIPLPEGIDADQVKATFNNGVLEVSIPMPEQQSNRRQIPIEAASSAAPTGATTASATTH